MTELLSTTPDVWWLYLVFAFGAPLCIRVFICWFEAKRLDVAFRNLFIGFDPHSQDKEIEPASFAGFWIGILEMCAYPALIVANMPTAIGGWLVFKTVNRWQYAPQESRGPFNRYLLANALLLFAAYFSARLAF